MALGLDRSTLFFPDRALLSTPESRGVEYEDVWLTTADDVKLHGWWVPGQKQTTLLWFHGNAGNVSFRLDLLAGLVNRVGCGLFVFDYRGYGLSEGQPTEKGTYLDAQAALDWLRNRDDVDSSKIVYYGVSLGASVAARLGVHNPPAALILDAPMPGVIRMARAKSRMLVLLSKLFLRARYDTLAAIRCVQSPVLVFHGEIDEVVPIQLGREVYEAAPGPKEWRPIPGASHNDTYTVAGSAYFEAIKEFLAKYAD